MNQHLCVFLKASIDNLIEETVRSKPISKPVEIIQNSQKVFRSIRNRQISFENNIFGVRARGALGTGAGALGRGTRAPALGH